MQVLKTFVVNVVAVVQRLWQSGKVGKSVVIIVGLAFLGALMPSTPKQNQSSGITVSGSSTKATPVTIAQTQPTASPKATRTPKPTQPPTPTTTPAPSTTPQPTATPRPSVQLASAVNLRSGPNGAFDKVTTLNPNDTIELYEQVEFQGERWYKIRSGTQVGWVSSSVVTVDSALVAALPKNTERFTLPTPLPPPTEPPFVPSSAGAAPIDAYNCPAGYPIKANQSGRSHSPRSNVYSRTTPVWCYANFVDAEAAGYRAYK